MVHALGMMFTSVHNAHITLAELTLCHVCEQPRQERPPPAPRPVTTPTSP